MWYSAKVAYQQKTGTQTVLSQKKNSVIWKRCRKLVLELIAGLLQFSFDPSTIHYNSLDLRGQKMINYEDKWTSEIFEILPKGKHILALVKNKNRAA